MRAVLDGEDIGSERGEVNFVAALLDELMREMLAAGIVREAT